MKTIRILSIGLLVLLAGCTGQNTPGNTAADNLPPPVVQATPSPEDAAKIKEYLAWFAQFDRQRVAKVKALKQKMAINLSRKTPPKTVKASDSPADQIREAQQLRLDFREKKPPHACINMSDNYADALDLIASSLQLESSVRDPKRLAGAGNMTKAGLKARFESVNTELKKLGASYQITDI